MSAADVIVIGAGPAGLAAAAELGDADRYRHKQSPIEVGTPPRHGHHAVCAPPHAKSPSQRRNHLEQELTNPRDGDFKWPQTGTAAFSARTPAWNRTPLRPGHGGTRLAGRRLVTATPDLAEPAFVVDNFTIRHGQNYGTVLIACDGWRRRPA
jgi:hypothetical protein